MYLQKKKKIYTEISFKVSTPAKVHLTLVFVYTLSINLNQKQLKALNFVYK